MLSPSRLNQPPPHSNGEVSRSYRDGGVKGRNRWPMTPSPSYDEGTSPFEWGRKLIRLARIMLSSLKRSAHARADHPAGTRGDGAGHGPSPTRPPPGYRALVPARDPASPQRLRRGPCLLPGPPFDPPPPPPGAGPGRHAAQHAAPGRSL